MRRLKHAPVMLSDVKIVMDDACELGTKQQQHLTRPSPAVNKKLKLMIPSIFFFPVIMAEPQIFKTCDS